MDESRLKDLAEKIVKFIPHKRFMNAEEAWDDFISRKFKKAENLSYEDFLRVITYSLSRKELVYSVHHLCMATAPVAFVIGDKIFVGDHALNEFFRPEPGA